MCPVFGKKEMMLEIFEIVTAFEKEMWRHCAELVNYFRAGADKLTDESHPIMKFLQHFFNTFFSHPKMKDPFKNFVNSSAIAKTFCKKKKSLLQAQSNRINHGNKERKYVSEGIKIRGVSNRHCLCRYENKRREVFRRISGPFYPQYM